MKFVIFLLLVTLFSCSKSDKITANKVVGIQIYDGFPKEKAKVIAQEIFKFYKIKTIVLSEIELPKRAYVTIKSPRYRADSLIAIQNRTIIDSLDFVLGVTDKDISITKHNKQGKIKEPKWKYNDFGVMGLAYCPGKSAIISSFRLKNKDKKLELTRLKKVAIHEFGHNLGLSHCLNKSCVMTSASEKISTIDNEKMQLCEKCKTQLKI
ncbi:matrixin family metalloprotease [Flavobacterium sp.]|uniref:matrixin family metalloprotease n=1 Tax=Flavobacterium sp. TaxID=239 RepID=UPI0026391C75|nr:matrixin family metalloprotease [Flavobacterium sp.]